LSKWEPEWYTISSFELVWNPTPKKDVRVQLADEP
jgi:hypothetical protein